MNSNCKWIGILFAASLILQLMIQIAFVVRSPVFSMPPKPGGDGPDYENIGWNLASGRGFGHDWTDEGWRFPYESDSNELRYQVQLLRQGSYVSTTARPPLLPWLIAGVYSVIERGPTAWKAIRLINAIALAVSGALASWIVGRILCDQSKSVVSIALGMIATTGLALVDRTTRTYAEDFLTEPLAMVITQLAIVNVLSLQRSTVNSVLRWASLSILFTLLVYLRSIFVFYLPILCCLLALSVPNDPSQKRPSANRHPSIAARAIVWVRGGQWSHGLGVMGVALLLLCPWWVRNCLILSAFMPLGTQGPITMLGGYCDESLHADGEWRIDAEIRLREELKSDPVFIDIKDPIQQEVFVARVASSRWKGWALQHADQLPLLAAKRAMQLWSPYHGRNLVWKALMVLGVVWLIQNRKLEGMWLIGMPLVTTAIVMMLYSTGSRFLVPSFGCLYALGGIGVGGWIAKLSSYRSRGTEVIDP